MTLPIERSRAVLDMEYNVLALKSYTVRKTGNQTFAKVPLQLLDNVQRCLRHYPTKLDIEQSAKHAPMVWGSLEG